MARSVKTRKRAALSALRVDVPAAPEQPLKTTERSALSGWPMILGWLAMLIFTVHACTHMVAAGDTWVAMACGRHFVNHGVDTVEPFSANSHKAGPTEEEIKTWPKWAQWIANKVGIETVKYWHPTGWVNQNWLTHVIFYSLVPKSSYADGVSFTSNALVYWKFTIYILTVICVYYTGRLLGVNPALCAVFSCFAMFVGRSFLDVRPAGFSNMLVAGFLFILALATYRNILYIWLIVPLTVFWCNVHGGYIYTFIMLIPFIGLHLLTNCNKKLTAILYNAAAWPFLYFVVSKAGFTISTFLFLILLIVLDFALIFFKRNLVSIGWRGVYHSIAAYFVAFLAMVLLNPFHLTNLTHTFVISASKHAERWRDIHEWWPAFDWTNPVGTAVPFAVMFGIALAMLGLWVVVLTVTSNSVRRTRKRKEKNSNEYQWPKIDLSLILIATLTVYMAIRSRRFIPIAAIAACPIIAMFIDQIIRAISATRNFHEHNHLTVSPIPDNLRMFLILAGALAVAFFGTWWGLKFKRIYLDAWPADTKLNSVFMRMTASDAKPFYALKFIRDNKLKGKMFNYWTEGGFIAWGQEPDPNTGRTPLQLFMDGRAQAAYDRKAFDLWSYIMAGGLPGSTGQQTIQAATIRARAARRKVQEVLTAADYVKIGQSVSQALGQHEVWVVLMPFGQFDSNFIRGLEHNPDWAVVFLNNKQKLLVDITTTRGRELFDGIFDGTTLYPDDYHRNLIRAHSWLLYRPGIAEKTKGLNYAVEAFNLNPSPAPMLEIILVAARFVELRPEVNKFCEDYTDKFAENQNTWVKQDGYRHRVEAARLAAFHLENDARTQKNTRLAEFYTDIRRRCADERSRISLEGRW